MRIVEQLELLVCKHSIDGVLDVLAEICYAKEERNWKDEQSAECWRRIADRLASTKFND